MMALVLPPPEYYERWGTQVWINPMFSETWDCTHPVRPDGHTTLYTVHDMESESVLYIGITGNVRRRFKQHRKSKPWWNRSEMTHLECYDSWDSACDAELSRIEEYQPVFNIAGNARRTAISKDALAGCIRRCIARCIACGGMIWYEDREDADNDYAPQHQRCLDAQYLAYELGQISHLPEDDSLAMSIRERWAEFHNSGRS